MDNKPTGDVRTLANAVASSVDRRIADGIREHTQRVFGIARPRAMTLTCPLAGSQLSPVVGWLQSVVVFHTCRISSWEICALVPGSITLDIRVSTIPSSPATAPTLTSLPGSSHYLSLNGYCTASFDTTGWDNRDIDAGSTLHIYVISATNIKQAVLGLQLLDLYGKVLQH